MRLTRRLFVPAALAGAVVLMLPSIGSAQLPPLPLPGTSSSPTPTPTPNPTGSSNPKPAPKPSGGTSTRPPSGSGSTTSRPRPPLSPTDLEAREDWVTREKLPPRTTTKLLGLLQQLKTDGSTLTVDDLRKGFGRFPVLGYVWYQDDFGAARYNPFYAPHAGTDLFAARGTPVIAVANGVIWKMNVDKAISGNGLWLREASSRYYYYGHFDSFASGIKIGARVKMGDIIGYVGNTGATHTAPHVHFEVHPDGTPEGAANPRLYVDRWLDDAEKAALRALGLGADLATLGSFRWTELQGLLAGTAASPPALWGTALGGTATLGSLDLSLGALIASIDPHALLPVGAGPSVGALGSGPLSWLRGAALGGSPTHLGD